MNAVIVTRSVINRRRAVLGYGIGLGLMVIWVMAIYPSVETELSDYVDAMPEAMKSLFGVKDMTSLAGFVHMEMFSLMGPLVFLALAITTGASAIAGEERDRILPMVLATGVGRGTVVRSKLAALAIEVGVLGAITLLSLFIGLVITGGGITVVAAGTATLQLAVFGLFFGTLALAIGAATGRKGVAWGITVAVALATYLVDALANLVSWLDPLQVVSPFHWYAPGNPLVDGLSVTGFLLLVGFTAAFAAAAVVAFDRRDVGV